MQKQKQDAYEQNVPSVLFSRAARKLFEAAAENKKHKHDRQEKNPKRILKGSGKENKNKCKKKGQRKRVWKRKDEKATKP